MQKLPLAVLAVLTLLLAAPTGANATFANVNSNGDAADPQADLSCDTDLVTAGEQCTLRAAIQTVNFSSDFNNTIAFNSLPADQRTITLGSQLPDITKPVVVTGNGVPCTSDFDPHPCVEVTFASSTPSPVLTFNLAAPPGGALVGAQGLALTNGSIGLRITGQTQNMFVTNVWAGLHLDATAGPNTVGISVEGNTADGNAIGGDSTNSRNVISFNSMTGIDISDADNTAIRGNYIGSGPNGITEAGNGSASTDGENIEVTNNAVGTQIGGTLAAAAITSQVCDGVCNVIMDAGRDVASNFASQIDLRGESGAGETESFDTTVRGNYVGMAADGATTISRGTAGFAVLVNNSDSVTVGGPADGDRNRFNNNATVLANNGGANNLVFRNNWINLTFDGTAADANSLRLGIGMNLSGNNNSPVTITENRIAWFAFSNFPAISASNESFVITDNVIGRAVGGAVVPGGGIGIRLGNLGATVPSLISGNTIDGISSGGAPVPAAIEIDSSDGATIVNNTLDAAGSVTGSHGDGIRIEGAGSAGNFIGGSTVNQANTITADRDAIRVEDTSALSNLFGRNLGTANADETEAAPDADLFIDLGTDGPLNNSTANGGIEFGEVEVAGASVATGDADPNTTVRVFTKPIDGSRDVVGAFLGSTTADGTGAWRLEYESPQPEGLPVAATQTDGNGNTSELSPAVATDATGPPAPTITAGPTGPTLDTTPSFGFSANEGGGTLSCSIDQGAAQDCTGGTFEVTAPLADGPHTFRVIQSDVAENPSAEATRSFVVDTQVVRPVISGPSGLTRDRTPTFTFAVEDGATVNCTLDGAPVPCSADGFTTSRLTDGPHSLTVTQTDAAGNVSGPATRRVRIDATPPRTIGLRRRNSPFDRTPTFRFRSSEPGSTFQCKVDRGRFRACRSPYTTRRLRIGRHTLRVRAIDRVGNVDPTPLVRRFRVRRR